MTFLSQPANGRPQTCPDDAVDPGGAGGGPMGARCSYRTTGNSGLVQLRGSVLLEGAGDQMARGAEGMRVTVHDASGKASIGRTLSDAQGHFTVSVSVEPGQYLLRVVSEETDEVLAERTFVVTDQGTVLTGLDLTLPLDPSLQ